MLEEPIIVFRKVSLSRTVDIKAYYYCVYHEKLQGLSLEFIALSYFLITNIVFQKVVITHIFDPRSDTYVQHVL